MAAIENMRAEFEAWARSRAYGTEKDWDGILYTQANTAAAWSVWKHLASRQPVGQEPAELTAAVQILRDSLCNNEPQWRALCIVLAAFPGGDAALLAPAPAAVPVDLSKFRDAIMHAYGLATSPRFEKELLELYDLITIHPQPAE